LNPLRAVLVAVMVVLFALAFVLPWTRDLFELPFTAPWSYLLAAAFVAAAWFLLVLGGRITRRWQHHGHPPADTADPDAAPQP
ncbi:MAG: hypothetical protein OEY70_14855, partial [Acidimicrobiia bacterium]|nr:hypothetical protein [Acidimicrobiia bacterium]